MDENALAAFAEGMGAEGDRQRIEDHLAKCEECVGVVAQAARGLSSHTEASVLRTSEDSVLARGTRVGRYVVDVLVGRGAMGAVYAAKDPDLKRKVAVKLLRAEGLSGPARLQMRARLLREAQAMARLSHPEVITVYDVGSFGDHLFIAMEFVDGGTLRQWRSAQHRSCAEILAVYERAGSGLAAAHEAGLIHRDFKPDNVLVGGDGRVRVLDFGLARSIARGDSVEETLPVEATDERGTSVLLTRAGTLLGTPAYMAPEQLRGNAADARSDIFGFCVSLYEALYGNRPFAGSTVRELLTAVESGVVRATPKAPRVPAWVRTLLLRGLRAAPETRLSSMRELLVALRANDAKSRRRRVASGIGVAGAVGIVLVAGWYARSARDDVRNETATRSSMAPFAASTLERVAPPTASAAELVAPLAAPTVIAPSAPTSPSARAGPPARVSPLPAWAPKRPGATGPSTVPSGAPPRPPPTVTPTAKRDDLGI